MASYVQADRPMTVQTPLGDDVLLLVGFSGSEGISQLFNFHLDLLAENTRDVPFDKILGAKICVTLNVPVLQAGQEERQVETRYFNGICNRFSQGGQDDTFRHFRMEIVPHFWVLSRRVQSRIFQHMSVPDVLRKVLEGMDVTFELQGTFHPRDYCVQYRESDFSFASRLMEEEGICYFFEHTAETHKLVLANTPQSHRDMPIQSRIFYEPMEGGIGPEDRIHAWEKVQELRSGKFTLWDHCFELPHKHLEADRPIQESVTVGKVSHKLKVGGNDRLEIYDYPGEYAQRFDGVDKGGGDRPADLEKIFEDNLRTVNIRMQQEALPGIVIQGSGSCRQFVSGYKFRMEGHYTGDGEYVLTTVQHSGNLSGNYRSGDYSEFLYSNNFTCIPLALPFRPPRVTPKPVVQGTQTAVVVGPQGEEIYPDKYGRVKVQFHWDREGKYDADSSCWIRVATLWAGRQWGVIHIPRIGQEVLVAFQEGDPDQPIIVGSVYNADQMPSYKLPDHKTRSGIKTYSSPGGKGYNEIRFEDKAGQEQIFIHGQKDIDIRNVNDWRDFTGRDRHSIVKRDHRIMVENSQHLVVNNHLLEHVKADHFVIVNGKESLELDGSQSWQVKGDVTHEFNGNHSETVGGNYYLKASKVVIEGTSDLHLKVGSNHITINSGGVTIMGSMVNINTSPAPVAGKAGTRVKAGTAEVPAMADQDYPGKEALKYENQMKQMPPWKAAQIAAPAHNPNEEANQQKKGWVEVELVDTTGQPVAGEKVMIQFPDGSMGTFYTDQKGQVKTEGHDSGQVKISFPDLDEEAVEE